MEDRGAPPSPNASPVPSAAVNMPALMKLEMLSPCPMSDIVDEIRLEDREACCDGAMPIWLRVRRTRPNVEGV